MELPLSLSHSFASTLLSSLSFCLFLVISCTAHADNTSTQNLFNRDLFEEDIATLEPFIQGLQSTYSFDKSKRLLGKEVYTDHLIAFYSGCRYRLINKKFVPVASSCGFKYRKNKARSERIEWEHIVPAWHFGHQLQCWQNGGRLHCRNNNPKFRQMEADMHNLVPAIGEINGDRSNYKYSMISGEPRAYGKPVNMEIEFKSRTAEPPESVQGDIARTYFYMVKRYQLQLSSQQKKLFVAWNNSDPVDAWERTKNQRVKALQGDENSYITHYKKLTPDDIVVSAPAPSNTNSTPVSTNDDISSINQNLRERLSFLFDYLPAQVVEVLLLIAAVFIWWKRRRNKQANTSNKRTSKSHSTRRQQPKSSTPTGTTSSSSTSNDSDEKPAYLKIQSALNRYVLSIEDDGRLVVEKSSRAHAQRWQFTPSNRTEGFVFIQHIQSGKVLAIADALKQDNAPVVLEDQKRRSNNHQEWKIIHSPDSDQVVIENRATDYVLNITDANTDNGAEVASYRKKSRANDNQQWVIR